MTKRFILILTMLAMLSSPAFSQSYFPDVKVSERTTILDGKTYYVHRVELRQTYYSICKAYNVTVEDIEKANPGGALNQGLKVGMDILIPMKNDPVEKKIEALQIVTAAESGLAHTIQGPVEIEPEPNQKRYRIPEEVQFTEYRVKWIDNIYSIAKKNKISVESIQFLNDLTTTNLQIGQILRLPLPQFSHYFENLENLLVTEDEVAELPIEEEPEEEIETIPAAEPFYGVAKVALILPFDAGAREPDYNYYDFYSGFLMGVNQIKKQGMNIDLNVLDEFNYGINDTYDFIVGPVFYEDLEEILDFSIDNRIPVISPLDPTAEALLPYDPYLIQVPSSQATQIKNMIRSIGYDYDQDNVIVLHEEEVLNDSYYDAVIAELTEQEIPYKEFSYGILKGRNITSTLINSYIDPTKMNHFIIASEKESFASDAVRNVSILTLDERAFKIIGYGSQRLRNFETIETEDYQNVNMHFSTGYFVDYRNPDVKNFVFQFRALYGAEPNTYAFLGHDIATYFLDALNTYGRNFIYYLEENPSKKMQSNLSLHRKEDGGLINEATIDIVYQPDYVIEVK